MPRQTQICVFNDPSPSVIRGVPAQTGSNLIDIVSGVDGVSNPAVGAAQAGAPVVLNPQGRIDSSLLGQGTTAVAGEALLAGNLVHLYSNAGVLTMERAYAASTGVPPSSPNPVSYPVSAEGFVTADVNSAATATVSFAGLFTYLDNNSEFSISDLGKEVFLSPVTAGGITKTRPSGIGQLDQSVGYVVAFSGPNQVTVQFIAGFKDFSQISGIAQVVQGGTGADLSLTGGANRFVRQSTVGGAFTVSVFGLADIPQSGATNGQAITWNGSAWAPITPAGGGGIPGAPTTSVQFNNAGAFAGSANFEWDNTNQTLSVTGTTTNDIFDIALTGQPAGLQVLNNTYSDPQALQVLMVDAALSPSQISIQPSGVVQGNNGSPGMTVGLASKNDFTGPVLFSNLAGLYSSQSLTATTDTDYINPNYGVFNSLSVDGAHNVGSFIGSDTEVTVRTTGTVSNVRGNQVIVTQNTAAITDVLGGVTVEMAVSAGDVTNSVVGTQITQSLTTSGTIAQAVGLGITPLRFNATVSAWQSLNINSLPFDATFCPDPYSIFANDGVSRFGGMAYTTQPKSSNYTLTYTDYTILADATGGPFTLTLPTGNGLKAGQVFCLKKIDTSANVVTVSCAVNIDGSLTQTLNGKYTSLTVQWDGTQYWQFIAAAGVTGTFALGNVFGSVSSAVPHATGAHTLADSPRLLLDFTAFSDGFVNLEQTATIYPVNMGDPLDPYNPGNIAGAVISVLAQIQPNTPFWAGANAVGVSSAMELFGASGTVDEVHAFEASFSDNAGNTTNEFLAYRVHFSGTGGTRLSHIAFCGNTSALNFTLSKGLFISGNYQYGLDLNPTVANCVGTAPIGHSTQTGRRTAPTLLDAWYSQPTGTPEGSVSAVVGSFCSRLDSTIGDPLYVKANGSSTTGWAPAGSVQPILTKVANYTATNSDHTINCNGTFTVTLPSTGIVVGKLLCIKNIGAGVITISSAVNIDGSTTQILNIQYMSLTVQWDGTQWWIV